MSGWLISRECPKCKNDARWRRICDNCYGTGRERPFPLECRECDGVGKAAAK